MCDRDRSKMIALWSVKISVLNGFKTSLTLTRLGMLVVTRSRILFPLVGVLFTCSKKKSFSKLTKAYSFPPDVSTCQFQHARGKLKSPVITILE